MRKIFLIFFLLLSLSSCDHGLKPPETGTQIYEEPGFGGTVYFKGTWPDTVYDLRVVAFRNYPPSNIINEVLEGKAKFSQQSLPRRVDSTKYEVLADTGKWEYIVVALQYGSNIFSDWKAIGVYDTTEYDTIPTPIYIPYGKFIRGINITCDFDNPPPQPFKFADIIGFLITKQNLED